MRLDNVVTRSHSFPHVEQNQVNTTTNQSVVKSFDDQIILHDQRVIHTSEIETVVSKLNEVIEPLRTNLKFQFHEKLNEYYVAVVNPITNEVIKEIPPKKMLDMYAEMAELMGILIDKKI